MKFILLFSDRYQNGIVLSYDAYVKECKAMKKGDFNCHQAIEVAPEMVQALKETLNGEANSLSELDSKKLA